MELNSLSSAVRPHLLALVAGLASLVAAPARASSAPVGERVDALLAEWNRPGVPGCVLLVAKGDQIIDRRAYGLADLENRVPVRPETVFNIASISKQFTAAAVALLAEEGKLSVDDEVRRYVPELPDYGTPIRISHLLHHTSGLRDHVDLLALAGWNWVDDVPEAWILDLISRQQALNFRPGEEYLYCNTGYFLLGLIVKRVSGQTLARYTEEHIFRPLGMTQSRFHDDRRLVMPDRAVGHVRLPGGGFGIWRPTYEVVGDGGLLTSAPDLLKWVRNFSANRLGRGGAALIERLTADSLLNSGKSTGYGFGLKVEPYRGLPLISHGGSIPGYKGQIMYFPTQQLTLILLSNDGGMRPTDLARKLADIYLEKEFPEPVPAPAAARPPAATSVPQLTAAQLADFAGRYFCPELNAAYDVRPGADGLVVTVGHLAPTKPKPIGPDRFGAGPVALTFTRDAAGSVTGFRLDLGRTRGLEFARTP